VDLIPFSLKQTKAEVPVWEQADPSSAAGVLALLAGIAIRDEQPERFLDAHLALFAARHDHGEDIRDPAVIRRVLRSAGVNADAVSDALTAGWPLQTLRKEQEAAQDEYDVFGVPTFIAGDGAVFVRLMERPTDPRDAITTVERVVDLLTGWPQLNEFKWTRIPR
jgi:predicted DsbA family dithiol-disulfide isomerase